MQQLTQQQLDILASVLGGTNTAVRAYAGSGKTATSVEALNQSKASSKMYVSFGKSNAEEMNRRLGAEGIATTIHSLLLRTLSKTMHVKMSESRDYYLVKNAMQYEFKVDEDDKQYWNTLNAAKELLHYSVVTQSEDFTALAKTYDILDSQLAQDIAKAAKDRMLWSIHKYGLSFDGLVHYFASQPEKLMLLPKVGFLVIDECQDLSPALRTVIGGLVDEKTTVMACGDPLQSIYGFAGASLTSYDDVSKMFCGSNELPMSMSFRVPSEHKHLVEELVPDMECYRTGGTVLKGYDYSADVSSTNKWVTLARTGAELLGEHTRLTKLGVEAAVDDKSLMEKIVKAVKAVNPGRSYDFSQTMTKLDDHFQAQVDSAKKRGRSTAWIKDLSDATNSMVANALGLGIDNKAGFEKYLADVFSENLANADVVLRTVHKAKGSEAKNVAILGYDTLGIDTTKPDIEEPDTDYSGQATSQEQNVKYVGLTRSTDKLVLN
jgi:superfamily I DNA/RNA helicase